MFYTKNPSSDCWKIEFLSQCDIISRDVVVGLENFLNKEWLPAARKFPCEDLSCRWYGLDTFGVPSPIISVKMSSLSGGLKSRIYSIQKKPELSGTLGAVAGTFPEYKQFILKGLSSYSFGGCIQIGDCVSDDRFVATQILRLPYYTEIPKNTKGKHYWVNVDFKQCPKKILEKLDSFSLVPVSADDCNSELVALGMARKLSAKFCEDFLWKESFVIKSIQKREGVIEIYNIDNPEQERRDARERIKKLIQTDGMHKFIIQPYIPGCVVEREGKMYHEIWQLNFVYLYGEYFYAGGMTRGSLSKKVREANNAYLRLLFAH